MKILNIALALLFFLFAYFQLNDVDPWIWVSWYAFLGILGAFAAFRKYNLTIIGLGMAGATLVLITNFSDLLAWIRDGMPSISESMKAETKYVELVREYLGLGISLIFLVYLFLQANAWQRKQADRQTMMEATA